MHVHMPKPLHGWRAFLDEVGIIVVGVLIALAAEQAVQSIEWREKVDSALFDMDNELGSGDGPQAYGRLAIYACIANDLNSLRASIENEDRSATREAHRPILELLAEPGTLCARCGNRGRRRSSHAT